MKTHNRLQFEHLANELIQLIFEYLAAHELFYSFKKLNRRLTAIVKRQPLCLPNNRHMTLDVYYDYLTSIIPKHTSQFVYLHLTERYAPHAVEFFRREIPINKLTWFSLKAVTIDDLPLGLFGLLLYDTTVLSHVHSLSLNFAFDCYHHSEYKIVADFAFIVPILTELPRLRSLYLRMHCIYSSTYLIGLERARPQFVTHRNLHTLMMKECSRNLLVELLDQGHLPKLCRLHVTFYAAHDPHDEKLIHPEPLKQIYVPELRYVKIELHEGVGWVFTYLEELQRASQLEDLVIHGFMISNVFVSDVPRVDELRQWLLLTKFKQFTFRMNIEMRWFSNCEESLDAFLDEYRQVIEDESVKKLRTLKIFYPSMSLIKQVKMNESILEEDDESMNSSRSSNLVRDDPVNENCEEMEIYEMEYMRDELIKCTKEIPCWHRLRKINLEGDVPDNDGFVGDNIPYMLHIVQRSPYFRELHIKSDLDFGRVLASSNELGILLSSQLEILSFTGEEANCSLLDLVNIIDKLFSYSSSPCLKQLTFKVDAHPRSWLTVRHLVRGIGKMFDRFPKLNRFNLHCPECSAFQERKYNLSELAPQWSVLSSLRRPWIVRSYEYRHKPHILEIWL
ncbi:hypothetical protein I4U23_015991 [Adineta vaga]|nr:hypothetical protein I4U23_015991 [Adineta vaga]